MKLESLRPFNNIRPRLAEGVWIDPTAVVIGDVEIGAGASIWPTTVVRGDIHHIRIGARTNVQDGSVLHVTHASRFNPDGFPLRIGAGVTIGHKVMLHGCTIGDSCLIGMSATILDGAVLEPRIILGAGSLVPGGKVLEGGHLWMGTPVKRVRALTEQELTYLEYVAENYVKLAATYLEEAAQATQSPLA